MLIPCPGEFQLFSNICFVTTLLGPDKKEQHDSEEKWKDLIPT
jgi:hypothetical protein